MNIEIHLEDVFGPPRSKNACTQLHITVYSKQLITDTCECENMYIVQYSIYREIHEKERPSLLLPLHKHIFSKRI